MPPSFDRLARLLRGAHDLDGVTSAVATAFAPVGVTGVQVVPHDRDGLPTCPIARGPRTHVVAVYGLGPVIASLVAEVTDRVRAAEMLRHAATLVAIRLALLGLEAPLTDHTRPKLTARQLEVACLVARGCTNPEIAAMLSISANAVKKHVSRVLAATGVSNRTELAAQSGRWAAGTCPGTSGLPDNPATPQGRAPPRSAA